MRLRVPSLLILALMVPVLAACGGSDESGGPSTVPNSGAPEQPLRLTGVATTLDLDPQTIGVLDDNNVTLTPIAPARRSAEGVRFPITGGEVRPDTFSGRIRHAGGLSISDGRRRVLLRDFVIETRTGQITADTGAGRIPILNLDFSSGKRADVGPTIALTDVPVKLTAAAAAAIDEALSISVLTASIPIARATVRVAG